MSALGFVWYELVTHDIDAALAFYGPVIGWENADHPGAGERYAIVSAAGRGVAGVMRLPEGVQEPFWIPYVGTPAIDDLVRDIAARGGTVHKAPFDIPTVGRIAMASDPQGAGFALIQSESEEESEAFSSERCGHAAWHELHTSDWKSAFDFYSASFGWAPGEAMDMGPMGTYQMFDVDGRAIGGMVNSPDFPRPAWLVYLRVDEIDAARGRIEANGGSVLHGPSEIPGGEFIIQARDPQGAMFAVVAPRKG